ncbi:MAG: hypothetical protein ACRD7E_23340 [Bryobacteraceae bacterium]
MPGFEVYNLVISAKHFPGMDGVIPGKNLYPEKTGPAFVLHFGRSHAVVKDNQTAALLRPGDQKIFDVGVEFVVDVHEYGLRFDRVQPATEGRLIVDEDLVAIFVENFGKRLHRLGSVMDEIDSRFGPAARDEEREQSQQAAKHGKLNL